MYVFTYARMKNKSPAVGPYGTPCSIVPPTGSTILSSNKLTYLNVLCISVPDDLKQFALFLAATAVKCSYDICTIYTVR